MLHLSTKQIITLALMLIILPIIQVKTTYAASPDVCTSLSSCITDTITWATGPSLGLASGSIGGFIFNLTSFIGALLFSLSALMILLGGILYILSAGDESRAAQAKKMITYAILGFFVGLAAGMISIAVQEIYLAATPESAAAFADPIIALINRISWFLYAIGFPLSSAAFLLGGIMYILSAGDEKRAAVAKNIIFFAIIGLFIILFAVTISSIVQGIYTGAANPGGPITTLILNFISFAGSFTAIASSAAILYGGLMYIFSAGDEKRAEQAKKIIIFSIIGLVIAVNAGVLVGLVRDVAGDPLGPGVGADPIISLIGRIGVIILAPLALIATTAIIYGGYTYITSAGEEDKARRGKQIITYSLVGIFITLISALIVNVVVSL